MPPRRPAPTCLMCGRRQRPYILKDYGVGGHGLFCTLRCASEWAHRVAEDHIRKGVIVRPG